MLSYLLAGVADKMIDDFDFMLKQEQPFEHCCWKDCREAWFTCTWEQYFDSKETLQKNIYCVWLLEYWNIWNLVEIKCMLSAELWFFKKWRHFQMLKTDNKTLWYNCINHIVFRLAWRFSLNFLNKKLYLVHGSLTVVHVWILTRIMQALEIRYNKWCADLF